MGLTKGGWLLAAALFIVAVGVAFRSYSTPAPALERDAAGAVSSRQYLAISLAKPGDCIESIPEGDTDIDKVAFVPCAEPHQAVALGETETSDVGTTEVAQKAAGECIVIAERATGVNPDAKDAGYKLTILPPGGELKKYLCLADYAPSNAPVLGVEK
ncbi:MAG: hypothetical protein LBR21_02710 [Propionibacteriaceae bacterium]|nr:hypothetical protein [Propionibacteriaceae bacterium]